MKGYPRAILHFDGDSFFASVEQMMDHRLRGKVVVTGGERGAITSVSVEGKKLGLGRGMSLREIKIRHPDTVVVSSDYTSYSIFAQRMYAIVKQYAPIVDEYSIDECFADITGLERAGRTYADIALEIKTDLETSLGVTFGVGLAPTKTLAKIASKARKPAGFTAIPSERIAEFLGHVPIHNIWGLGGATGTHLQKLGVITALDFIEKDDAWLSMHRFGKAYRDVWLELRGSYIKRLGNHSDDVVGSLMRTRTFSPPSKNREFIFSQLSKNVEEACEKARRHDVRARGISFYLKTQEFTYHGVSLELALPTSDPSEILQAVEERFDEAYAPGVLYRATGVTLRSLRADCASMPDLFGESTEQERRLQAIEAVDHLNGKYGRHTLFLGSSMAAYMHSEKKSKTRKPDGLSRREGFTLSIEKRKKTLHIPYLGRVK
jgi:DNA polymerase-4